MGVRVVPGRAGASLAAAMARHLGVELTDCSVERFDDGELRPRVGHVRGDDVFLVQPTGNPVSESLVELLLLLDACRRGGAARITAVVPYFGYARQDRRARSGEAVGARAVADALTAVGADRVVVVDPHTAALESMFGIPVEMLTAVPVLLGALAGTLADDAVVLAPDLGAAKLGEQVAELLDRPVAVVRKTRLSGTAVRAREMAGDVAGRPLLVVDDMISTAATIQAAARVALAHGAAEDITVAATHAVLVGDAAARLGALPGIRLVSTDTVPCPAGPPPWMEVCSVAPLLAEAVRRLHDGLPLDDLLLGGPSRR